jgi:putative cardiolipin synthase
MIASDSLLGALEERFRARSESDSSGLLLLAENREALTARLAAIDAARHSLDMQYYLWFGDASGMLMLEAVLEAADRGVLVRVLIDDLQHVGADNGFSSIAAHPNVDLRVFNPFEARGSRLLGRFFEFLSRIDRLNSRMHNKLLVADDRVAICGGRNLGDAYFGLSREHNFHDYDLLGVGEVARQLTLVFETYWQSPSAESSAVEARSAGRFERRRRRLERRIAGAPELAQFRRQRADFPVWIDALAERLVEGRTRAIYDRPGTESVTDVSSATGIRSALSGVRSQLLLENAYWLPSVETLAFLGDMEARGVEVRFLTNSLASHDVPAVNGAYKRWRSGVIEAGIELFELREDGALKTLQETRPRRSQFVALHSKVFVIDRRIVYVGSHNLDPRSNRLNTELGLLVESEALAKELADLIERDMRPENSWQVKLGERGRLYWQAGERRLTRQPARGLGQRLWDVFLGLLPIEDQL